MSHGGRFEAPCRFGKSSNWFASYHVDVRFVSRQHERQHEDLTKACDSRRKRREDISKVSPVETGLLEIGK